MSTKAKLRLGIIAVAAAIVVYFFFARTKYYLEAWSSEKGKYVYIVEEYEKDQHRIKKVDIESDKVLWKTKIEIKYRLNHQARRKLSPIFFDKKNVYYYIHDISNYHLAAFNKNTGTLNFSVDLKKNIKKKIYPSLYLPFLNLEDKIIIINRIDKRSDTLITVIDKEKGIIIKNYTSDSNSYPSTPLGLKNKDSEFFTIISPGEIFVFNKKNIENNERIKAAYMFNYLQVNDLYYFNRDRQLIKKNLKTGKTDKLWKLNGYFIDIFKAKDSFITYSGTKGKKEIICLNDKNGKVKWHYSIPKDYNFYSYFAKENQKYDPDKSVYCNIDYKYIPLILNKEKKNENNRQKKIIIIERGTGKVCWVSKTMEMPLSDLLSSRIFKFKNKFVIQIKKKLAVISQDTGEIVKVFSLVYKEENKEKTYYLGRLMTKQIVNKYLFLSNRGGILRIDLESFQIKKTDKVSKTLKIKTEQTNL